MVIRLTFDQTVKSKATHNYYKKLGCDMKYGCWALVKLISSSVEVHGFKNKGSRGFVRASEEASYSKLRLQFVETCSLFLVVYLKTCSLFFGDKLKSSSLFFIDNLKTCTLELFL